MRSQEVTVINRSGLHARPASLLVKTAGSFHSEVTLIKNGMRINAKSVIGVMGAGISKGTTITVEVDGDDEEEAIKILIGMIEDGLGEDSFERKIS